MARCGRQYLICYDIADPKRLIRVHRACARHAAPLQYSVFLGCFRPEKLEALLDELDGLIEPALDDVRIYPLPSPAQADLVGTPRLPQGVRLLESGRDLLSPG